MGLIIDPDGSYAYTDFDQLCMQVKVEELVGGGLKVAAAALSLIHI